MPPSIAVQSPSKRTTASPCPTACPTATQTSAIVPARGDLMMFFIFIVNMIVLGWVGAVPPTDKTIVIGQISTLVYFGIFLILPFVSKKEEAYLIKRGGLPASVNELLKKN